MALSRFVVSVLFLIVATLAVAQEAKPGEAKPIKALLITGGPFHDYNAQKAALTEGVKKRINIEWTIYHEGDRSGTSFKLPIYEKEEWAKGYDIVIHNECFADVTDEQFIRRITKAHEDGVPGVFIHCCMHTFRAVQGFDEYRKMLGVTTVRHEASRMIEAKAAPGQENHPIMKGFPAVWKSPANDEVYVIEKLWPDATALATCYGVETKKDQPCVWINQYGKARIFGTTLGHPTQVISDEVYLDTMSRGILWATDKLDESGKPKPGFGPRAN
jgi:type 1 glutamine amidotransferase